MIEGGFYPLVSIVIPVYNGANYLREAIDSALNQTYKNIEILVINDGSNDSGATDAIARSYGSRIRYFKKENGGVATALNLGIKEMRGDYFSWLSHDDLYVPNKIEAQIKYLKKISNHHRVIFSDCKFIDGSGLDIGEVKAGGIENYSIKYHLTKKSTIHGCSLLIPKDTLLKAGGFNESLRATQDYDMWYRISDYVEFDYLSLPLVLSRQHAGQDSRTLGRKMITECDNLKKNLILNLKLSDLPKDRHPSKSVIELVDLMIRSDYNSAALAALTRLKETSKTNTVHKRLEYKFVALKKNMQLKKKIILFGLKKFLRNGA